MDNKEIHNKMLEILSAVHQICQKEGLTYMLTQGTLLGAIREKGFIEWDIEDSDIMMYRKDYDAFHLYYKTHQDECLFLLTMDEMGLVPRLVLKTNADIFVEVILIDYLPKNKIKRKYNRIRLRLLYGMLWKRSADYDYRLADRVKDFIKWCLNKMIGKENRQKLYKKISQKARDNESGLIFFSNEIPRRMFKEFKSDLLMETISVPFEDTVLNVPRNWDAILRFYYGDDYMKPKRNDYYVS